MIDRESVENLSDSECIELMTQLVHRLNLTAYGRGYKDGFNDGKNAEFQKYVYEKAVEGTKKSCLEREESKSGYWIVDYCYSYKSEDDKVKWRYVVLCDECGMVTDITTNKPDSIPIRCCPHCGATMVLREEDKDRAASLKPAPVDPCKRED